MITFRSIPISVASVLQFTLALALVGVPTGSRAATREAPEWSLQSSIDASRLAAQTLKDEADRDREQDKAQRYEELYDSGREALDEGQYEQALRCFTELAQRNGPQTDAALYWKAYAENKRGKRDAALATIADLKKRFPQSRWQKDASALAIEVRQQSGQSPSPDAQNDEELKLLAIQGLMNSNPERGIPLLEKVLNGSGSPREKSQALFVLAQSGEPKAMEVVARVAQGKSNPELQRRAVEYLGMYGGDDAAKLLGNIYNSTTDSSLKRAVLKSYMLSGDEQALFGAAKSEKDPELKREAIQQLGLVGGESELEQLYRSESSEDVRREILQSFFLAGDSKRLVEAALDDKDPELRRAAIKNLGLMGDEEASKALSAIYAKETDRSLKEEVLNAYFLEGNATALVAIARFEKDAVLKKKAVEKLSIMDDKVATDYLIELLQK